MEKWLPGGSKDTSKGMGVKNKVVGAGTPGLTH